MTLSAPVFQYSELRALKLHDRPYRYVVHGPSVLNPDTLESLSQYFPTPSKVGYNDPQNLAFCEEWKAFLEEVHSSSYREALEHITGLNLSPYEVGVGFRYLSKLSQGSPHPDVPRKKVTHLIYFNHEWPHGTGRLRVLGSKNLDDVHDVVTPLKGNGIIFVVSNNSFHGFEPFEGVRKAIQVNFEKTGLFSKLFSRYE